MAGQDLLPSQEIDHRDYHQSFEYSRDEETQIDEVTDFMSVEDVSDFLRDKLRIPQNYCHVFKDNYIDGREFLSLTEEEVKAMIPPIGLAKRIIRYLPSSKSLTPSVEPISAASRGNDHTDVPVASNVPARHITSSFTPTEQSCTSVASLVIPDNWRPEVMQSFKAKCITDSTRNEIIRVLANLLFSLSSKPGRHHCNEIAKKLVLKFPSTKDQLGNGYQSWSDKLVERIRNVIKLDRKKGVEVEESPSVKRPKKQTVLLSHYPVATGSTTVISSSDDGSVDDHVEAMKAEMQREKPRDTLLSELMKLTYATRRDYILNDAPRVSEIFEKYPALKRTSMVIQEMGLIMNKSDAKSTFDSMWTDYVPAVVQYAKDSKKKVLSNLMKNMIYDEDDDTSMQVAALNILAAALGRGDESLSYLYQEHSATQNSARVCRKAPERSQPWIAARIGDSPTEYLIVCEQEEVTKDFILQQPDRSAKSATYLSVSSDIKRVLVSKET